MWVYKITNRVNGKVYVGKTNDIDRRWYEHRRAANRTYIAAAIRKHGVENFSFEVLERGVATDQELSRLEMHWIAKLGSFGGGYNANAGGEATEPKAPSTRARMSAAALQRGHEYAERMSAALRGKCKSAAHRAAVSQAACARPTARLVEFDGERLNVATWARRAGISKELLKYRLDRGVPMPQALAQPNRRST